MDRASLRKKHKNIRLNIPREKSLKKSEKIANNLFSLSEYKNAENIMVYFSANGEVLTDEIIERAKKDGKRLFAPVVCDNFEMEAVEFKDNGDLSVGSYNITEPKGDKKISPEGLDLIIVPGVVFGKNMHRLGYGRGYYDRFLKKIGKNTIKAGISFSENIILNVTPGEFDVPLDMIICEECILRKDK